MKNKFKFLLFEAASKLHTIKNFIFKLKSLSYFRRVRNHIFKQVLFIIIFMIALSNYKKLDIIFYPKNIFNIGLHASLYDKTYEEFANIYETATSPGFFKFLEIKNERDYSSFKGLPLEKADVNINFEGNTINLVLPIYTEKNRYYLPLTELIEKLNGTIDFDDNYININFQNNLTQLSIKDDSYIAFNETKHLNKKLLISDEIIYVSMFDFCKIFNLKTHWNENEKILSFYFNKDDYSQKSNPNSGRPALLRLEDITAGGSYTTFEDLEKLRIVADYLYKENIPFHVAWIPRYINPVSNPPIDNDISNHYSMFNSNFVFTLDYLINRNGAIGLHGYTHQYGSSVSVGGKEFPQFLKDNIPRTDEYASQRINSAIEAAKTLDIPCIFFEAPHYSILPNQAKVVENYFDYMYEPYTPDGYTESKQLIKVNRGDRIIKYIPTPLDYLEPTDDVNKMISKLNTLKPDLLGSFFFHPYIEFKYIQTTRNSQTGYPNYTYSNSSMLHSLFKAFEEKGFKFEYIYDLK